MLCYTFQCIYSVVCVASIYLAFRGASRESRRIGDFSGCVSFWSGRNHDMRKGIICCPIKTSESTVAHSLSAKTRADQMHTYVQAGFFLKRKIICSIFAGDGLPSCFFFFFTGPTKQKTNHVYLLRKTVVSTQEVKCTAVNPVGSLVDCLKLGRKYTPRWW